MTRFSTLPATVATFLVALGTPALAGSASDSTIYSVVINHEEQYSIWPQGKSLAAGWKATKTTCGKDACLKHIEEVWTDMRPLSVRKFVLDQLKSNGGGD